MWLEAEELAAFVWRLIASGQAMCEGCTLPLVDPDEQHDVFHCADCNEVKIWHPGCTSEDAKQFVRATARRVNWRWN